jgi:hypothetical protein
VLPDVGRLLADQHPFRQLFSIHRSDLVPRCHPTAVPGQPITAHGFPSRQLAKAPTGSEPHGTISMRRPNATPNRGSIGSARTTLAASSTEAHLFTQAVRKHREQRRARCARRQVTRGLDELVQ